MICLSTTVFVQLLAVSLSLCLHAFALSKYSDGK